MTIGLLGLKVKVSGQCQPLLQPLTLMLIQTQTLTPIIKHNPNAVGLTSILDRGQFSSSLVAVSALGSLQ